MEPTMISRDEFLRRYWDYYLLLEKDFLDTERYLSIDAVNFNAFSNEYIKQYQTICSEIDVIAKSFCKIGIIATSIGFFSAKSINPFSVKI